MRCNRMILDVLDLVNATQCTQMASSVTPVLFRKSDSTNPGTQGRHSIATGNPRTSLKPEARRCKVAWHCTLQGTSRMDRKDFSSPLQTERDPLCDFFSLDPLFMARRSEVSGLRMTSSCGQRLKRWAMMAGDAGMKILKSTEFQHPIGGLGFRCGINIADCHSNLP